MHLQAGAVELRFIQLDSQQFAISFGYNRAVIDSLKAMFQYGDREWHQESKTWRFPLRKYEDVQRWALQHFSAEEICLLEQVTLCESPQWILTRCQCLNLVHTWYEKVS